MKKTKLATLALAAVLAASSMPLSVSADSLIEITMWDFPDEGFRTYITDVIDTNTDGFLSPEEISAVTTITYDGQGRSSNFIGLEMFTSLNKLVLSNCDSTTSLNIPNKSITQFEYYGEASDISFDSVNLAHALCGNYEFFDIDGNPYVRFSDIHNGQESYFITNDEMCLNFINFDNVVAINTDEFPDPILLDFASNYDFDNNGYLSEYELYQADGFFFDEQNLISLKGIENFHYANSFMVSDCNLTTEMMEYFTSFANDDLRHMEYISVGYNNINALDLRGFKNLRGLVCNYNDMQALYLPDSKLLYNIYAEGNRLTGLDLSNQKYLLEAQLDNNEIYFFDISGCPNLEVLTVNNNKLPFLNLNGCTSLREVYAYDNDITEIDVSDCPGLLTLSCGDNNISELNLANNPHLMNLLAGANNISEIDIQNNPSLETLDLYNNPISEIDLSNAADLVNLDLGGTEISELDLSYTRYLHILGVNNTNIDSLDLSNMYFLRVLYLQGVTGLTVDLTSCSKLIQAYLGGTKVNEWEYESRSLIDGDEYYFISYDDTQTIMFSTPTGGIVDNATNPVYCFAERLYTCALDRLSEIAGARYWYSRLNDGARADLVAHDFLFSQEVTDSGISDKDFIIRLYKTFMDRNPSDPEIDYWLSCFSNGETRESVFAGFVNSQEWVNNCYIAGIDSGSSLEPTVDRAPSLRIIGFVNLVYETCLGRPADDAGLEYWATGLANGRLSASDLVRSFILSDEYISGNHTDEEYVYATYTVVLGREPDEAGLNYWVGTLSNGMAREDILNGFFASEEFAEFCEYLRVSR